MQNKQFYPNMNIIIFPAKWRKIFVRFGFFGGGRLGSFSLFGKKHRKNDNLTLERKIFKSV